MGEGARTPRPLKSAAATAALLWVFWAVLWHSPAGDGCAPTPLEPDRCFGGELLWLGIGLPLVTALVTLTMDEGGLWWAATGAVLCLVLGLWVSFVLLGTVWSGELDSVLISGPLTGALVYGWTTFVPPGDTGPADRADPDV